MGVIDVPEFGSRAIKASSVYTLSSSSQETKRLLSGRKRLCRKHWSKPGTRSLRISRRTFAFLHRSLAPKQHFTVADISIRCKLQNKYDITATTHHFAIRPSQHWRIRFKSAVSNTIQLWPRSLTQYYRGDLLDARPSSFIIIRSSSRRWALSSHFLSHSVPSFHHFSNL